jgi:hypothetical protein
MFHEVYFEIKVPIKYQGDSYNGTIAGHAYVDSYIYGADADGNRGEERLSLESYELDEIVIDMGEEDRFLMPDDVENKKELETYIFEDAVSKVKG